jgi:hypothetical protein
MFNRRIKLSVMSGVVALGLALSVRPYGLHGRSGQAGGRCKATQAKFRRDQGRRRGVANAKGVLCAEHRKGAFVGVESGECVLTKVPKSRSTTGRARSRQDSSRASKALDDLVLNTDDALASSPATSARGAGRGCLLAVAKLGTGASSIRPIETGSLSSSNEKGLRMCSRLAFQEARHQEAEVTCWRISGRDVSRAH